MQYRRGYMGTSEDFDGALGRREAIKRAAVGAATAGLVWSAPRVEGLSLRPAYAAASSGGPQVGDLQVTLNALGVQSASHVCAPGTSVKLTAVLANVGTAALNYSLNNSPGCTVVANGADITSPFLPSTVSTPGNSNAAPITFITNAASPPSPTITLHYTCT